MVERPIGPGPASSLVLGGGPRAGFEGELAAVALWDRALADAEDAALAGGRMRGPSARAASVSTASTALTSPLMAGPTTPVETRRLLNSTATLKMWKIAEAVAPMAADAARHSSPVPCG